MPLVFGLLITASESFAAHWYVRPSSAGSNTGADWSNAWNLSTLNSRWSSIAAGDTIWLAGGTYTTAINVNKSGTSGSPIYIKRVLSSDSVPASAAGWSSSFDSQVIINVSGNALDWNTSTAGSYVIVDGRVTAGLRAVSPHGAGGTVDIRRGQTGIQILNCDLAGPGVDNNYPGAQSVVSIVSSSGILFSNCWIHACLQAVTLAYGAGSITFDHCKIYSTGGGPAHPNMIEMNNSGNNNTFRYCEFTTWPVEGFMFWNGCGTTYIYGCYIHDPSSGAPSFLWPSGSGQSSCGPIYLYNNTFVNIAIDNGQGNTINFASGSQSRNNIYWNASWARQLISDSDYNFSSGSTPGANSISSGLIPFINLTGGDIHLISIIGLKYPKDKGAALSAAYNTDPDGKTRGSDGSWDIGAYEYGTGAPSTNPVIVVTPASLNFGTVEVNSSTNLSLTVRNAGAGTLTGTASVALPFQIVSGGTYSLGSNQTQLVTVRFSPTSSGTASQTVSFTGGGGASASVSGTAYAVTAGLSFDSTSGTIEAPFTVSGSFISQPGQSGVTDGGRATYVFGITNAGTYVIQAEVNAPSSGENSLYVNIDAEPTDPAMIWQINVTSGVETQALSWQGSGTFDNPEFVPKVFTLTAGVHQLIVRGPEPNTQLGRISLLPYLPPPSNLRVISP